VSLFIVGNQSRDVVEAAAAESVRCYCDSTDVISGYKGKSG